MFVGETKFEIDPWYLPFSLVRWQRITKAFYLHGEIINAMMKGADGGRSTYLVHDSLRMYTAAMARGTSRWSDFNSLAMSSTYFEKSKLTVAVIFGCSPEQMHRVECLLARSPEVKSHPFLTVGIFAELHKDRMQDVVKSAVAECDVATMQLGLDRDSPPVAERDFKLNKRLRECRLRMKVAEEEVRATKGLLQKMVAEVEEAQSLLNFQDDPNFAASTKRFKQRFTELEVEFDTLMARSRMTFDDMTYSEELVSPAGGLEARRRSSKQTANNLYLQFMTEILSRDAERAREQAKLSTVIAFVAMLYLPITTVAVSSSSFLLYSRHSCINRESYV